MVSNQDALGSEKFPTKDFQIPHDFLMAILSSQGITFDEILICPHDPSDNCDCRKPKVGLMLSYLSDPQWDRNDSFVIGDRETDIALAKNLGIKGIKISDDNGWEAITQEIIAKDRKASVKRKTNETDIDISLNLDNPKTISIDTGIGFFDHMLEQIAKHAGISLEIKVMGDLHIDEHHSVEDTALALGEALKKALGDKRGIGRYGFVLPMDEALAQVSLDLSGRAYCKFDATFPTTQVGALQTPLIPHFFRSLSDTLQATLHLSVTGEDTHHMVEGLFKAFARALRMAIQQVDQELPSSKGVL